MKAYRPILLNREQVGEGRYNFETALLDGTRIDVGQPLIADNFTCARYPFAWVARGIVSPRAGQIS